MIPASLLNGLRDATRGAVSHVKPDGDAIGSLLALGHMLGALGKSSVLSLNDPVPAIYRSLPGADAIVGPQRDAAGFDAVIAVDCSSVDRLGRAMAPLSPTCLCSLSIITLPMIALARSMGRAGMRRHQPDAAPPGRCTGRYD